MSAHSLSTIRPASSNDLPRLQVNHLSVRYREIWALEDVTVSLRPGRLTGIIGPNGAGKSTMMRAMLGLVAGEGSVSWGSEPLLAERKRLAYLPQRNQIDWSYPATAWDVVMMGQVRKTGWFRRFSATSKAKAREALARVEMNDFADRPIGCLSGGQQQRIFLARALAQGADALFLDEPFTGVDKRTETILFSILRELVCEGKIVLVVHHDLGEAIQNFDDLILLNKNLIACGPRKHVLQDEPMQRAYGGYVSFLPQVA